MSSHLNFNKQIAVFVSLLMTTIFVMLFVIVDPSMSKDVTRTMLFPCQTLGGSGTRLFFPPGKSTLAPSPSPTPCEPQFGLLTVNPTTSPTLLSAVSDNVVPMALSLGVIAFTSDRDGNNEIYIMNSDGTNQIRLTNNTATDYVPKWSPDASKIAFISIRDGNNEIYVMNADGSNQVRLTNDTAFETSISWSPDGTQLAFGADINSQPGVYLMNSNGTNIHLITVTIDRPLGTSWSPDGTKIAFAASSEAGLFGVGDIYVINTNGTNLARLTLDDNGNDYPVWSPDGTKIAYRSRSGTGYFDWDIFTMNPDGSGTCRVTTDKARNDTPTWSPDGQSIIYSSFRDGNYEIYKTGPFGGTQTRLINNSAVDSYPSAQLASLDDKLASYGIKATGWTDVDKNAILAGVVKVGASLSSMFGGGTPSEAFRRIMYFAGKSEIDFVRDTTPGYICVTTNAIASSPGQIQAIIKCGPGVQFKEQTGVHELGHVFEGRTGGTSSTGNTYFKLIQNSGIKDSSGGLVMGNGYTSKTPDWLRGKRGWGSAASTPPAAPCVFQQDAFTVVDDGIPVGNPTRIAEIDEAAADMFLNWVYSKVVAGGFQNSNWSGVNTCTTGTPQPTEKPGDARNNFMNTALPTLATRFPTSTATPTP